MALCPIPRCVVGYEEGKPQNPLVVIQTGTDEDEYTSLLSEDTIAYGLIRMVRSDCCML